VIRRGRPEDAEALAALQVRAWQAAYSAYVEQEDLQARSDPGERTERWRSYLAPDHPESTTLVADRGRLEGFVTVGASRDDDADGAGELYAIYVAPELIGTGVGRELLVAGEQALRDQGFSEATLWTFQANDPARRFYERAGWRVDERPHDPGRWGWAPSVRYRRPL
jgi:GNAT superfamily N-acetyltransferase